MNTLTRIITATIGLVPLLAISADAHGTIQMKRVAFAFAADQTAMAAGVYSLGRIR